METRYREVYEDGELVESIPYEVSDEEIEIEAIEAETQEANDQALAAYQNFSGLTRAKKDAILKGLLGEFISRNRGKYIPGG